MLLVCVRHLPTEWNDKGLLQGQRDIPLIEPDEAALSQVRRNRGVLERLGPFDRVWTSTLQRARRTAELHGFQQFTADAVLDELNFGCWEGRHRDELEAVHGEEWRNDPRGLVLGESLSDLEARIRRFLDMRAGERKSLVFGHGSWMRALRSILEVGDVRAMNRRWIANNEILRFELDGRNPSSGYRHYSSGIS